MRKFLATFIAALTVMTISAQTMNIVSGSVTTAVSASEDAMTYTADGTKITVAGRTFAVSDIDRIYIDESQVEDNTVTVTYSGTSASVVVAGNIASHLTTTVNGGHVAIIQDDEVSNEITYTLQGSSTAGSFWMDGSLKTSLVLNGVTLTNPDSAAINIRCGKRISVELVDGTTNTLTDGTGGSQKACFAVKGHTEFKGAGTLNITGRTAHAFWGKEYVQVKASTGAINILGAVGDGFNVNQYFLQNGGTITIKGVGDDGIAVSFKTDDNDKIISTDEDSDNTGELCIQGGTLNVTATAAGSKGLKSEGPIIFNEEKGTTVVKVVESGGVSVNGTDYTASSCVKSDKSITVDAGTLTLTNSGQGGKGMSCEGTLTVNGGTIDAKATGSNYGSSNSGGPGGRPGGNSSSSNSKSAKAIKIDGAILINGGTIKAAASSHEGLEGKSTMEITGGHVYATSSDDAINSASHMTISGGYVMAYSTGNDGLDANGNLYIKGGVVYTVGTRSPELGIDANTEGGYKLYIQGGTIISIGGLESGFSSTQTCYSQSSCSSNTWYALYNGSTPVFAFKTPSVSNLALVVSMPSTPTLKSGVTVSGGTQYFNGYGLVDGTISGGSTVSLSTYTGGNGGGGWRPW